MEFISRIFTSSGIVARLWKMIGYDLQLHLRYRNSTQWNKETEIKYCSYTKMFLRYKGARKVSFTACHSGKLYLACTSPRVLSTSLKKNIDEQDWLQFFCNLNSPQKTTCRSGKLRTEFTSPITKSASPRLPDTTFFARWLPMNFTGSHTENESNFPWQNNLILQKMVSGVDKVVNFKDFSRPNKEIKYFSRT